MSGKLPVSGYFKGKIMKKSYILLLVILLIIACNQNKNTLILDDIQINNYIENLNDANWRTVYLAKDSLEQLEHEVLPYLIKNLNAKNKFVKLKNTADLIYPGATEYYGSGWVVDYDIDWLSIRTGWVIEDITFENFGYREFKITEDELIKMQKNPLKYQEYLESGKYDFKISPDKIKDLKTAIKKTNNWWNENSSNWTRLQGITDALNSKDIQRQSNALQYLRHGEFCINGLTREYFEQRIRPIVEDLLNSSEDFICQDAELLLSTVDYKGDYFIVSIATKCWGKTSH